MQPGTFVIWKANATDQLLGKVLGPDYFDKTKVRLSRLDGSQLNSMSVSDLRIATNAELDLAFLLGRPGASIPLNTEDIEITQCPACYRRQTAGMRCKNCGSSLCL